jgi:hypothetical protein
MDQQNSDSQEDKVLPGTLFDFNENSYSHPNISHEHRHSLTHTPSSLVEVTIDLLKSKIIFFSLSC